MIGKKPRLESGMKRLNLISFNDYIFRYNFDICRAMLVPKTIPDLLALYELAVRRLYTMPYLCAPPASTTIPTFAPLLLKISAWLLVHTFIDLYHATP